MTVMLNKDKDKVQGQDKGLDPEGRGRDQGLKFLSFKDEERKPRATSLSVDLWASLFCSVFSLPRSEGWPHHGRTFSIYPSCHSY